MKAATMLFPLMCLALGACSTEADHPTTFRHIEPVCVDDPEAARGQWTCDEPLEVECATESVPDEIYVVVDDGDRTCDDLDLVRVDGPFEVGTHDVVVVDAREDEVVCATELRVVDETPPVVVDRSIELWPPNHRLAEIDVYSCFEEVIECDDDWHARILWASSDEPDDDTGDGNTAPDIAFVSDETVSLRAERKGDGNGRVYWLGYEVEDASGNITQGECRVFVPHDQGKHRAVDDGARYVVER